MPKLLFIVFNSLTKKMQLHHRQWLSMNIDKNGTDKLKSKIENNMRIALTIFLIMNLIGCGQKGPLVLPDEPSEHQPPVDNRQ